MKLKKTLKEKSDLQNEWLNYCASVLPDGQTVYDLTEAELIQDIEDAEARLTSSEESSDADSSEVTESNEPQKVYVKRKNDAEEDEVILKSCNTMTVKFKGNKHSHSWIFKKYRKVSNEYIKQEPAKDCKKKLKRFGTHWTTKTMRDENGEDIAVLKYDETYTPDLSGV